MTISNIKINEFQELYKSSFGIEISFEQAKIQATHLLEILVALRRGSV